MNAKEANEFLNSQPTSECSCEKCVSMCKNRVCWGTPEEIKKLIEYNPTLLLRLMIDWFCGEEGAEYTFLLCPATIGFEGRCSPYWPGGKCTFLTEDNRCEIHDLKPSEGKISDCKTKNSSYEIHKACAITWESKEGYELVKQFRDTVFRRD